MLKPLSSARWKWEETFIMPRWSKFGVQLNKHVVYPFIYVMILIIFICLYAAFVCSICASI